MSDNNKVTNNDDSENESGDYVPPPQKSIEELLAADQEDESLRRYKETLLGNTSDKIIFDASNPKSVIVKKLSLLVDSRPEKELDLSDISSLKKQVITIKEGVNYKVKIDFVVQREIVHGLKYVQKTYRLGVPGNISLHYI
uniref:Rho GDP-dissociation inhibitor 1 n=1 Tax=Megaselia scalaris TaxID=36166 RepID=T1GSQ1_MEGSC